MPAWETVRQKFQAIWGYPDFRPPQGEIVHCLLQQRDAVIILPTGGGKSICFQLPALLQQGLTLVVSPLVALMENQVQELHQRDPKAFQSTVAVLHSELASGDRKRALWALEYQRLRLLYLSPETLLSPAVWQRLCEPTLRINGLVLDEAHCLVQWGETFRPAYYRLGTVRSGLLRHKAAGTTLAIAAFTATADPQAQQTIERILQLRSPQIFRLNPYRANLRLQVRTIWTPRQRRQQLRQFIQSHNEQAGLVYVRTRRDGEELAVWLSDQGYRTAAYHAGLSPGERRQMEQAWIEDDLQFVVCTNAFGMGINKPNVRWVVHFHSPTLLSEYVQEAGRAGRDGKPATALTLVSEPTGWLDSTDKQRQQFFARQAQKQYQLAAEVSRKLPLEGEIGQVSKQFAQGAIALSLLHSVGQLDWLDPFHYRMGDRKLPANLGQANLQSARQLTEYLYTGECRWQFLLRAFGFEQEAMGFRCGQCDNCYKHSAH